MVIGNKFLSAGNHGATHDHGYRVERKISERTCVNGLKKPPSVLFLLCLLRNGESKMPKLMFFLKGSI